MWSDIIKLFDGDGIKAAASVCPLADKYDVPELCKCFIPDVERYLIFLIRSVARKPGVISLDDSKNEERPEVQIMAILFLVFSDKYTVFDDLQKPVLNEILECPAISDIYLTTLGAIQSLPRLSTALIPALTKRCQKFEHDNTQIKQKHDRLQKQLTRAKDELRTLKRKYDACDCGVFEEN